MAFRIGIRARIQGILECSYSGNKLIEKWEGNKENNNFYVNSTASSLWCVVMLAYGILC